MSVRLLGTGSADGWPNPFCGCASCATERAAGRSRAQACALVDDRVLLDGGPQLPLAAARLGVDLTGVRLLLLTHQHVDHCSPAVLMLRRWVTDAPLEVVGPPDVVAACRPWLAPDDATVTFTAVRPGDLLEREGYAVRVLPAAHATGLGADPAEPDAVLFDVTTPAGERVLWATDTGPLPAATVEAATGRAYDVVLLEETFGDRLDHGSAHLDLPTFAAQVRRLREVGAVVAGTDLVAVHLSHHNPPTPELARRLADLGARVVDDGALVGPGHVPGPTSAGGSDGPLRTLVLGGARSGKSREAERMLGAEPEVVYVATSEPRPDDAEWVDRLARHRAQRPSAWRTVEAAPHELVPLLAAPGPPLLVDCLTLWLTRVMDAHDAWDDAAWATGAEAAVQAECDALVVALRRTRRRVVLVSNEVGQGVVPAEATTRRWRDAMGRLNAAVAAVCEDVRWVVAGRVLPL